MVLSAIWKRFCPKAQKIATWKGNPSCPLWTGTVLFLFPGELLPLYTLTVIDGYNKLLCQSSCKSIMKMMCTCFKMIVNCLWLIRIMSCGDANQHWAVMSAAAASSVKKECFRISHVLRLDAHNRDIAGGRRGGLKATLVYTSVV